MSYSKKNEVVTGKVTQIMFISKATGNKTIRVKTKGGYVDLNGSSLPEEKGEIYKFQCHVEKKAGQKFYYVDTFEKLENSETATCDELVECIVSRKIPGIGSKTAQKMVERFGQDAIRILEEDTDRLLEIDGITPKKIVKIKKAVVKAPYLKKLEKMLEPYGVSVTNCAKLFAAYDKNVMRLIIEDPYLMLKVLSLSFMEVDTIALQMGFDQDAAVRVDAGLRHTMSENRRKGHTGMVKEDLIDETTSLLTGASREKIAKRVENQIERGWVVCVSQVVEGVLSNVIYPSWMYSKEKQLAQNILRINTGEKNIRMDRYERIAAYAREKNHELDQKQISAVISALENRLVVITGGPGTGKSTIVDYICQIYEEETEDSPILLAPTGKAAKRLSEATGRYARTIHSHFRVYDVENEELDDRDAQTITDGFVIIDEVSMLDLELSNLVLEHIVGSNSHVVLLGDVDQLPSIGAGAVLRDIIESKICPVIELTEIFRTHRDNLIYQNIKAIKEGRLLIKTGKEFLEHRVNDMSSCKTVMTDIYLKRVKEYGVENTVLLLPFRKHEGGVNDMNQHLQSLVNPPEDRKKEVKNGGIIYREGDYVMHTRRNSPSVVNGDTGFIEKVSTEKDIIKVSVRINGKLLTYEKDDLHCLEHAYAMSIHKSQGSEYKAVVTAILLEHGPMLYRNIPYVAISRGKTVVDLVRDRGYFDAIRKTLTEKRITRLAFFLKEMQ